MGRSGRAEAIGRPRTPFCGAAREHVLALAAEGRSLREIAAEVGVSHETVRKTLGDRSIGSGDNRDAIRPKPV